MVQVYAPVSSKGHKRYVIVLMLCIHRVSNAVNIILELSILLYLDSFPSLPLGKPLLTLRLPTLLLFPISLLPSISYFFASPKPALTTDIMALSFAHSALSMLKLDSLRTGCILLVGLFFYDIW